MPKVALDLKGPPFPQELTLKDIRASPRVCSACYNLSPGTAAAFFPTDRLSVHEVGRGCEENMRAAESLGVLESKPTWLTDKTRTDYTAYEVRVPLCEITQAVQWGCPSCILLQAAIKKLYSNVVSLEDPKDLMIYIVFCLGRAVRVYIYDEPLAQENDSEDGIFISGQLHPDRPANSDQLLGTCELYTLPGQPSPWPSIGRSKPFEFEESFHRRTADGIARHVASSPASKDGFRRIKEWLERCVADHADCREADSRVRHDILPKRVIQVGCSDNSGIQLKEQDGGSGQGNSPSEPCLALSHCWGDSHLPMLTRDTLKEKKKNIPWDSLSRTFKDAIILTRGIGVRYIWIDSLCILQDDSDDWKIEAAKMASIYEGALMVLSATASTNGDGGCFHEREPLVELQVTLDSGPPSSIFARRVLPHQAFMWGFVEHQQGGGVKNSLLSHGVPLFSRAWCFQERLLGTRTLHFLPQEMVFDCLDSTNCECGALLDYRKEQTKKMRMSVKLGIMRKSIFSREWRGNMQPDPERWIAPSFAQLIDDIFNENWRSVVESYSQKNITYASDTLPAFSGLASRWHRITGTDYLCGLWTDGLLPGLMWYADKEDASGRSGSGMDKRGIKHRDTYIAPSWSWASTRRPVVWRTWDFVKLSYFVNIDRQKSGCVYTGPDVFGGIHGGWLVISGKLSSGLVSRTISTRILLNSGIGKEDTTGFGFSPDDSGLCEELVGEQVLCLDYATNDPIPDKHYALILAPVGLSQHDTAAIGLIPDHVKQFGNLYRRIGITDSFPSVAFGPVRRPKTTIVIV